MGVALLMFLTAAAMVASWLRGNDPRFAAIFTMFAVGLMMFLLFFFFGEEILEVISPWGR